MGAAPKMPPVVSIPLSARSVKLGVISTSPPELTACLPVRTPAPSRRPPYKRVHDKPVFEKLAYETATVTRGGASSTRPMRAVPRPVSDGGSALSCPAVRTSAWSGEPLFRAVVTALSIAAVIAFLWLGYLGHQAATGTSSSGRSVQVTNTAMTANTVMVHDGDTLWSIATSIDPSHDPRDVVARLRALNHLVDVDLTPGQILRLR